MARARENRMPAPIQLIPSVPPSGAEPAAPAASGPATFAEVLAGATHDAAGREQDRAATQGREPAVEPGPAPTTAARSDREEAAEPEAASASIAAANESATPAAFEAAVDALCACAPSVAPPPIATADLLPAAPKLASDASARAAQPSLRFASPLHALVEGMAAAAARAAPVATPNPAAVPEPVLQAAAAPVAPAAQDATAEPLLRDDPAGVPAPAEAVPPSPFVSPWPRKVAAAERDADTPPGIPGARGTRRAEKAAGASIEQAETVVEKPVWRAATSPAAAVPPAPTAAEPPPAIPTATAPPASSAPEVEAPADTIERTPGRPQAEPAQPAIAAAPAAPTLAHVATVPGTASSHPAGIADAGTVPPASAPPSAPAPTTAIADVASSAPALAADDARLERLLGQLQGELRTGRREFQLVLDPPELGRVDVRIVAQGDGVVVRFVTERGDVAQWLRDDLPGLHQAAERDGLQVVDVDVRSRLDLESGAREHRQNREPAAEIGPARQSPPSRPVRPRSGVADAAARPAGGIDLFI
jgi:flagellar hook-length control protein FliK